MTKKQEIVRITLKLPKEIAEYFRQEFPHGKRSDFVAEKLLKHKQEKKIKRMENDLRQVNKKRQ